jgi:glycogen debranching enzyme
MPCPAQYNFFFTHDLLLTGLAAAHFDVARVKKDLDYLLTLADGVLPHAYYWKDDRYVTEFAATDNWNHFWFIMLSASYLRHSGDTRALESLYDLLSASLRAALTNKQDDDLMWARRPDWWDIGSSFGPRAYMTILAIRALREFVYLSTALDKEDTSLGEKEALAARMEQQLVEKLWDEDLKYLLNYYQDGSLDPHLYIGSLLAAHFRLLDPDRRAALVRTVQNTLLDNKLGIFNAFPMDFHQLIDFFGFAGNEAGDPGVYMNGGIWPHGNAWYALALLSIGEQAEALRFFKTAMTLQGITNSPNGQPAMYEYRNSDARNTATYGRADKPQFLWAAGWYLHVLYHLFGVRENEWNVALAPWLPEGQETARFSLFVGGRAVTVSVRGAGRCIGSIAYDGVPCHSAVVPTETAINGEIEVMLGMPQRPYVAETSSMLLAAHLDRQVRSLAVDLRAFVGHENETAIVSPWKPKMVEVNGAELEAGWDVQQDGDVYRIRIGFTHQSKRDTMTVKF